MNARCKLKGKLQILHHYCRCEWGNVVVVVVVIGGCGGVVVGGGGGGSPFFSMAPVSKTNCVGLSEDLFRMTL